MNDHEVTVSQVLHPETGEVLALEIVTNDGQTFFVAKPGHFFEGMRVNPFPNGALGKPLERVEIARLG